MSMLCGSGMMERAVIGGAINGRTSLCRSGNTIDALVVYARWGQPLVVGEAAVVGAAVLATVAGPLAAPNAVLLAGIMRMQLVGSARW